MKPFSFLVRFFSFVAGGAVFIAAFNLLIDPYLLFDMPRASNVNARKPAVGSHERLMKQYDALRRPARTLILGSSRTDIAFNPDSRGWRDEDRPVYNLSLVGAGPNISTQYTQHLFANRTGKDLPRTLIIGLDFESFLFRPVQGAPTSPAKPDFEQSLAVLADGRPNPNRQIQELKDYGKGLLTLDAILDSIQTIRASLRGTGADLSPRGRLDESAFLETAAANGIGALFLQKNIETVQQYSKPKQVLSETPQGEIRDMASLKKLIDVGKSINAEVVLFIQPTHADRLELFDQMGYWGDYERWKITIAKMVEDEKARGLDLTLWDFGGYSKYVQEPPPRRGDRSTRLKWFWEPSHYTAALGDLMIARMRNPDLKSDVGEKISAQNIDDQLARTRGDRALYRQENPGDIGRTREIFCKTTTCDRAVP